jgi:tetratricopeptide (TPR) repeat protein
MNGLECLLSSTGHTNDFDMMASGEKVFDSLKCQDGTINDDPRFEPALQDLAGVYYREKKWDEALALLERAKAVNPRSAHTLMLTGVTGIHAERKDVALDAVTELRQRGYPDQARRLEYLIFSEKYENAAASKK